MWYVCLWVCSGGYLQWLMQCRMVCGGFLGQKGQVCMGFWCPWSMVALVVMMVEI